MEKNHGVHNSIAVVRWKRMGVIGGLLLLVMVFTVLFLFNPSEAGFYPSCLFHAFTGWYCPGCGSARGLHQLLHGHPLTAFSLNPLMVLCLPFLTYALLSRVLFLWTNRYLPNVFLPTRWIWALLTVIILFWILRNIPIYPFTLLAP
ncbi:MAG: DUF2752 domain-containing protein [Planctomycetes bacterium]|nr:DUF2752 domain-containing protein [Planctomycetota bacterium]